MLNEEVVKQFFLELHEEEKNFQVEESQEILHAKKLLGSRECRGVYLFYKHLWLEEEAKGQNVIRKIGLITVSTAKRTFWTMNYDGWHKIDEQVISLREDGLIKTLEETGQLWKQTIVLEKNGLKYQNKVDGQFSLFDLEETITNYFNCVSYYHYRGRALADLHS